MTPPQQDLVRRRSSTRQFLFSKTDPKIKKDRAEKPADAGPDKLTEIFPAILTGSAFLDSALDALQPCRKFGAMIIRPDNFDTAGPTPENNQITTVLLAVAETLDAICQDAKGLWGRIEHDMLGCFFPGKNSLFGIKTAKQIRKKLAENRNETVSIGIAAYPAISFDKSRIIENAYKALDHAAFFGPDSSVSFDAVSMNISADKLYSEGDIDGAIEELKLALQLDPSNVNLYNSLGVCYGVQGVYEKAREAFTTAIQLDAGEVMAIYNIGLVNLLEGDQKKALERFLEAGSIGEDVFEILFQTGKLYLDMGNPEEGRNYLQKAVELMPASGPAFRHLGECYQATGTLDKAAGAYQKAIKLNPNDAAALSALGHLFDTLGENFDIALMFCRQSIEISPDNGLFRHRLGTLYLKQNRFEEALQAFKKAKKLGHDSSELIEKAQNQLAAGAVGLSREAS